MKPESTTNNPLTGSEYLLFNQMIVRLSCLEYVFVETFKKARSRKKVADKTLKGINRILMELTGQITCYPPYCQSTAEEAELACEICGAQVSQAQTQQDNLYDKLCKKEAVQAKKASKRTTSKKK